MTTKEIIDYLKHLSRCKRCNENLSSCVSCESFQKTDSPECCDAIDEAIKLLESGGLKTVVVINKYEEKIGEFYFDPSRQVLFNGCIAVEALKGYGYTILPG